MTLYSHESNGQVIGRLLAQLRIERELTQAQLAYETGISLRTLQRLEAGKAVNSDSLYRIMEFLGRIEDLIKALEPAAESPQQQVREVKHHAPRQRVRHSKQERDQTTGFIWPEDRE